MNNLEITRRETNVAFNYTGTTYTLTGNCIITEQSTIQGVNMTIYKDGQYMGNGSVSTYDGTNPKMNISDIPMGENLTDLATDITACFGAINSETVTEEEETNIS